MTSGVAGGSFLEFLDSVGKHPTPGQVSGQGLPEGYSREVYTAVEYTIHRLIASNYTLSNMTPKWTQNLAVEVSQTLEKAKDEKGLGCELLIVGNDRSPFTSLLLAIARVSGIRTIMELPNLDPHSLASPDIMVSDSLFGLQERTVKGFHTILSSPLSLDQSPALDTKLSYQRTYGVVISPGIDLDAQEFMGRMNSPSEHLPVFTVGFVARLAKEKAITLFLLAMRDLVRCSFLK